MILDLEQLDQAPITEADICIVGAGAAGIALAVECSRRHLTVLLLEGGGDTLEAASQEIYASEIHGQPHTGIHEGRFRTFGGTTTRWGGQILELDELDFERRDWVRHSGWPFDKAELTAEYQRALELEGVAPCILRDDEVWRALHISAPPLGEGIEPFFTRWCPQPDFGKLFRAVLESSVGITAYLHANLCAFELSESGYAFTQATCRTLSGRTHRFTARRFVLCTGAIETARLLLQPLMDGRVAPWNASGYAGRFFQDHIDVPAAKLTPVDPRQFHLWFDNIYLAGFRYVPKIKLSASLQKEFGVLAVGASLHCQSVRQAAVTGFRETLLQARRGGFTNLKASQFLAVVPAGDILIRKAWRMARHHRAYNPDDLGIDLHVHCEQAPDPDSRITLSGERDALGLFRSRLDWRIGQLELETVRKFADYSIRQFQTAGIASGVVYHESLESLESFANHAVDTYHHMGTARMAMSQNEGVVDPDCKLFGIENGFVCGSAVFPTSGFSNPTHTILALVVRLAEHLARSV